MVCSVMIRTILTSRVHKTREVIFVSTNSFSSCLFTLFLLPLMWMNKRLILIIGGVAAVIVAIVAVFFILGNRSQAPTTVAPTPQPISQEPLTFTTTVSPAALSASSSATINIFLNTHGTKIDGFQFIATLDGDGAPIITDADPSTPAIQIQSGTVTGMNTVTNSVVPQGGAQVIRYAMITQNASQPFTSSSPVQVATVTFIPSSAGSVKLDFNAQNTRANKTGTTDDTLIITTPQTMTVSSAVGSVPTPTPLAALSTASTSASTTSKTTTVAKTSTVIACDAACLTDNDCSSGLSCINNACRNPACSTETTCSCTGAAVTSTSPTPTPIPTATPKATATPKPTATPKTLAAASSSSTSVVVATPTPAAIAALPKDLPVSGGVQDTILLVVTGVSFMALGAFFMLRML